MYCILPHLIYSLGDLPAQTSNLPQCAAGSGGRRGSCCSSSSRAFCCHLRSAAGKDSPGPWSGRGTGPQTQHLSYRNRCSGSAMLPEGAPLVNPSARSGLM